MSNEGGKLVPSNPWQPRSLRRPSDVGHAGDARSDTNGAAIEIVESERFE